MKFKRERINNESGLSLVEVLAVIVILGILAAIAVPTYLSYIEKTTSEVCRVNRDTLKKDYSLFLMLNDKIHDDVQFKEYSQENENDRCPLGEYTRTVAVMLMKKSTAIYIAIVMKRMN